MCCENKLRLAQVSWRPTSSIPSKFLLFSLSLTHSLANYTSFRDELLLFGEEQHVKHIIMISFLRYLISNPKKAKKSNENISRALTRRCKGETKRRKREKTIQKNTQTATPEHKIE
jgi:hypothetical protein